MGFFRWVFDTSGWPRRWDCGDWGGGLAEWTISANARIWLAYWLIPALGLYLLRRRPDLLPSRALGRWCLAFVVLCGTTHLADAAAFWWPAYNLNAVVREVTADVSLATLALFVAYRRRLLACAGPEEAGRLMAEKDAALAEKDAALAERDAALADLRAEFDRRGRQNARLNDEVDGLRAELVGLLHREVTDADLADIRVRLHALRGFAQ